MTPPKSTRSASANRAKAKAQANQANAAKQRQAQQRKSGHGKSTHTPPWRTAAINNALAVREIYGKEKSPYRGIPHNRQGPGRLTGGQKVMLQAWTVNLSVTCLLGADGAKITGGFGTWETVAVPRNLALTQWQGQALMTMDISLMIDDWHRQNSVEPALKKLEALAVRQPGMLTPPSLRLVGPVPYPKLRWVITGIDYGDALRNKRTGARMRQELTVHLLQYRAETDLMELPRAKATAKPPRKYKVKKGDDLKELAKRFYHNAKKWQLIEKANKGMRGYKLPAKWVGKTIVIPQEGDKQRGKDPKKRSQHPLTKGKS